MTIKPFTTILTFAAFGGILFAQTPTAQSLLMALGANGKQMMAYQWKQRITVWRDGRQAASRVKEIRFDAIGQPQRITISQSAQRRMGPLMAHKAAEIRDDIQEVMQLATRYTNPQRLTLAIQQGEIWEGASGLRVHARSVILPRDELTMTINGTTYLATQVEVRSQHEGRPVTISVDYQQLPIRTRHAGQNDGTDSRGQHRRQCGFVRFCTPGQFISSVSSKAKGGRMQPITLTGFLCQSVVALAQSVHYDYDRAANFSAYHTYQWMDLKSSGQAPDQLTDQNIKRAVDKQLAMKGLRRVDSDADLHVAYRALLNHEKQFNGLGGGPRWRGFGQVDTSTIEIGKVIVELFDPARNQLVWRGDAEKTLDIKKDPDKNFRNLEKGMAKLFKNYPPGYAQK